MDAFIHSCNSGDAIVREYFDRCNRSIQTWFHVSRFWILALVSWLIALVSLCVIVDIYNEDIPFADLAFISLQFGFMAMFMSSFGVAFAFEHLRFENDQHEHEIVWHAHQNDVWGRFIAFIFLALFGCVLAFEAYIFLAVLKLLLISWMYLLGCSDIDKGERKNLFEPNKVKQNS